jgi:hypothetical protein
MMNIISQVSLLVGIVLLVVGYRKNNRHIMLAAGIVIFVAGSFNELAAGALAGWRGGY